MENNIYTTELINIGPYPMFQVKFPDGKTHTYSPGTHEWDRREIMKKYTKEYYQREKLRERKEKINKIINGK